MKKYKFAIIGCGRISFKHIEAIVNNGKEAELIAVCDTIKERAIKSSKDYKRIMNLQEEPKVYTDYKKMLEEQQIDIVTVATESGYHAEITLWCLNYGKHVIVEKPMALSNMDADRMIACSKERNVKLGVCYQNRYNFAIRKLREAVEEGRFGKLINCTARILWNRDMTYYGKAPWRGTWELDGGALMNQCIHNIDLLQWMLGGEADSVYAQCGTFLRDIEGEDFGAVIIRFKNGTIGIVEGSTCVFPQNFKETLDVFGETGTVSVGGLAVNDIETWRFLESGQEKTPKAKKAIEEIDSIYGFGHTALFKDMLEAIGSNKEPLINGEEGKKSLSIVLAAYKSSLTGQPIKLPMDEFSTVDMKKAKKFDK